VTTVCAGTTSATPLAFPQNVGLSSAAFVLEGETEDIQQILFEQTLSIGRHYWETRRSLDEAFESSAVGNWDGYNARPIDPISCSRALRFSKLLPMSVPVPEVDIDSDGEVKFEWYRGPRRVFSVTVRSNGELAYAGLVGASKVHGTEHLGDELPNSILGNIRRIFG
jgi:hypothetical protein